jgi:DNA-binding CsgD family transcriptional regulator
MNAVESLRAFSESLLALNVQATSAQPERQVLDALRLLEKLVPFQSAWWGEVTEEDDQNPRRNWLHGSINLSSDFADEWNALAGADGFASGSMQALGTVVRFSGHDDPVPAVASFSRKHRLYHAMATTDELPGSGMLFFVSLYRDEHQPAFDDLASVLFQEFTRHLLHHWHLKVQNLLNASTQQASDRFALADRNGELLYLGSQLGTLLREQLPGWFGSPLPPDLLARIGSGDGSVTLGRHRLWFQPCGELITLSFGQDSQASRLPPRERSVAVLYARGESYKEIARLLDLTPATVRTYIRNIYLQLGVRNKVELGSALNP